MRVVVIGNDPQYLTNFRGRLLAEMVRRGHEVHALSPRLEGVHLERVRALGVQGWSYPLQRQGTDPFADAGTFLALARLLRRLAPDVVFTYTIKPLLYGSIAAHLSGVRRRVAMVTGVGTAFTEITGVRRSTIHLAARALYRVALARQDVVFFQNPDDEALFRDLGLVRASQDVRRVNGSGIDLAQFAESALPAGVPTFTLVARLHREKGVREYAEAARIVRSAHPDARFLLVGPYERHPDAIRPDEVDQWVKEGTIDYRGFLEDVRPVLRETSVYVLPSYREGTPRSVLEAMALGRPIVTTDAPGCRETVIDGENGYRVPVRDAAALAVAMTRFITDPASIRTMGRASRNIAEAKYDVGTVNTELLRAMGLLEAAA